MRLSVCGLIASTALLTALPTQAQPSGSQITAMVDALRMAAPKTDTAVDGLYSPWKVKPGIIPSWSKQCVGRELTAVQFGDSPETAREVVSCIMRRELNKQFSATNNDETAAVRRVACWWLTGNYTGCSSGTQAAYVQRVLGFYQEEGSNQPTPSPSPTPTPSPSPSPTPTPSPSPSPTPTPSPSPSPTPTPSPSPSPTPTPSPSSSR
jgi:cell division septation protein DedD